ncbi:DNA cytosine methyltransferase [Rickettsia australis]|uniref:DNA cytosine methyltransferase n=1 Tax=Rickettsia australis TaxID=787 RepID=UPI0009DA32D3
MWGTASKRKSLFCLRQDFSSEYTFKYVKPEESYERIFLDDILEKDLYYINDKIRILSINECKYLMGFPQDHYVADGLKGYRQLGNSVIPQVIANIYDSIQAV